MIGAGTNRLPFDRTECWKKRELKFDGKTYFISRINHILSIQRVSLSHLGKFVAALILLHPLVYDFSKCNNVMQYIDRL